jgi:hypothetical protein
VLAAQARDAVSSDDPRWLYAVCRELGEHRDDPVYTAEFFRRLGPADTRRVAERVHDFGNLGPWKPGAWPGDRDRDYLTPFDEALATATRSPGWDRSFARELFRKGIESDHDAAVTVDLLRHGVYSADALTDAGQDLLMSRVQWNSGRWIAGGGDAAPVVLDAISRNPAAAQEFLSQPDLFDDLDKPPQSTLRVLLDAEYKKGWGDDGRALGHVLEAAMLDGPDPVKSAHLVESTVSIIATQIRYQQVELSDPLRESLARIVVGEQKVAALAQSAAEPQDAYNTWPLQGTFTGPRFPQSDVAALLGELTNSARATATLLAGSATYLRRQLSDGDVSTASPYNAGALFGLVYRSHRDLMTEPSSAADLLTEVTNIVGVAGPQGRLAKSEIQGARSFVEMVLSGRAGSPGGESFETRVQEAMDATHAEALWAEGRLPDVLQPPHVIRDLSDKTHARQALLPYHQVENQQGGPAAYWDWITRVKNAFGGDQWNKAWQGFHDRAEWDAGQ